MGCFEIQKMTPIALMTQRLTLTWDVLKLLINLTKK